MELQVPVERLTLRPAHADDSDWAADLLFAAGPSLFSYAFALKPESAQQALRQAFPYPGHAFSYEYTQVLEVDDQPAGLILAYAGQQKRQAEQQVRPVMAQILPLARVPRILANLADLGRIKQEVAAEHYYVVSLGILPQWRNRGLGTALLRDAELSAQDLGAQAICLDVAYTNTQAQRLFIRLGYHTTCSKTSNRFEQMTDAGGLHRMEKGL
jgi:ribosomal protein S18 acetylase RimI-like enzyme